MTRMSFYRSDSSVYLMKANYQRNMMIGSLAAGGFFLTCALALLLLPAPDIVIIDIETPPLFSDTLKVPPTVIPEYELPEPSGGRTGGNMEIQHAGLFVDSLTLVNDTIDLINEDTPLGGNEGRSGPDFGDSPDIGEGDFFNPGSMPYLDTTTTYTFMDSLDRLPSLVHMEKPPYPRLAQLAGVEGSVLLEILVGIDGAVENVRVHSETNPEHDFAENAVDAAYKARFVPALRGRDPVKCWVSIPVTYRIDR